MSYIEKTDGIISENTDIWSDINITRSEVLEILKRSINSSDIDIVQTINQHSAIYFDAKDLLELPSPRFIGVIKMSQIINTTADKDSYKLNQYSNYCIIMGKLDHKQNGYVSGIALAGNDTEPIGNFMTMLAGAENSEFTVESEISLFDSLKAAAKDKMKPFVERIYLDFGFSEVETGQGNDINTLEELHHEINLNEIELNQITRPISKNLNYRKYQKQLKKLDLTDSLGFLVRYVGTYGLSEEDALKVNITRLKNAMLFFGKINTITNSNNEVIGFTKVYTEKAITELPKPIDIEEINYNTLVSELPENFINIPGLGFMLFIDPTEKQEIETNPNKYIELENYMFNQFIKNVVFGENHIVKPFNTKVEMILETESRELEIYPPNLWENQSYLPNKYENEYYLIKSNTGTEVIVTKSELIEIESTINGNSDQQISKVALAKLDLLSK